MSLYPQNRCHQWHFGVSECVCFVHWLVSWMLSFAFCFSSYICFCFIFLCLCVCVWRGGRKKKMSLTFKAMWLYILKMQMGVFFFLPVSLLVNVLFTCETCIFDPCKRHREVHSVHILINPHSTPFVGFCIFFIYCFYAVLWWILNQTHHLDV